MERTPWPLVDRQCGQPNYDSRVAIQVTAELTLDVAVASFNSTASPDLIHRPGDP